MKNSSSFFLPSLTITWKTQLASLPAASATITTTLLLPTSKKEPDWGEIEMILADPELSEISAAPAKSTNAPEAPSMTMTDTSSWQVTTGSVVSTRDQNKNGKQVSSR